MTEKRETALDVFISYSHDDADIVAAIDIALRLNGLRVFLDVRDVKLGDSLVTEVFKGIERARSQIVVVSSSSIQSGWVTDEVAAGRSRALAGEFRTIPIRIDDSKIPAPLAHLKYLDLRDWLRDRTFRRGIAELLAALGAGEIQPAEVEIAWCLIHFFDLVAFALDLYEAIGLASGSQAEMSVSKFRGSLALKWLMNDIEIAPSLTMEALKLTTSMRLRTGGILNGLRYMQLWLEATATPDLGTRVGTIITAVDEAIAYLTTAGFELNAYVSSEDASRARNVNPMLRPLCEALRQTINDTIRLGVPTPRT